jgi:hypothetical protein
MIQRGDPIPEPNAVARESLGNAQGARTDLRVVGGMDCSVHRSRDHLALRMISGRMVKNAMTQQRPILHQTKHDTLSCMLIPITVWLWAQGCLPRVGPRL